MLKVEYNCLGWPVCVLRPNDGTGELFSDTREDIEAKAAARRAATEVQTTEAFYAEQRAMLAATIDAVSNPTRTSNEDGCRKSGASPEPSSKQESTTGNPHTSLVDESSSESSSEHDGDAYRNIELGSDDSDDEPPSGHALIQSSKGGDTALDSGATEQEHCAKNVPGQLHESTISTISGLTGSSKVVTGMKNVRRVKNVMCIPGISRDLLSVGRLLDQYGDNIVFTKGEAYLTGENGKVLLAQRQHSGLYIVCNNEFSLSQTKGEANVSTSVPTEVARERVIALHRAFGHASIPALKVILKNRTFSGISESHLKLLPPCEACLLGKTHKAAKGRKTTEKATQFAERLCAD